jgi:nanoRNase/pAp phosphatase (c-di-AMP/oligoRNAs hydrolase)
MYISWDHATTKPVTYICPKMGQDLSNFTQQNKRETEEDFHVLVAALYSLAKILGKG